MSIQKEAGAGRSADKVYDQLKAMAVTYTLRPGERINEVELARQLNVSRTPLREALNRLVSEGFLRTTPNRGFFSRSLDPKEIFDLYDFRCTLERSIIRLACERATEEELDEFERFVVATDEKMEGIEPVERLRLDEEFHVRIARLTHNAEFIRCLENVNSRIHFSRWIDSQTRMMAKGEHLRIVKALRKRDVNRCDQMMREHIEKRFDQIVELIRNGIAEIYVGPAQGREKLYAGAD